VVEQRLSPRGARAAHRKPPWFDPRPVSFAERDGVFLPHGLGTGLLDRYHPAS
jgi:hypothetical protein